MLVSSSVWNLKLEIVIFVLNKNVDKKYSNKNLLDILSDAWYSSRIVPCRDDVTLCDNTFFELILLTKIYVQWKKKPIYCFYSKNTNL